jgi:hypothetical protein
MADRRSIADALEVPLTPEKLAFVHAKKPKPPRKQEAPLAPSEIEAGEGGRQPTRRSRRTKETEAPAGLFPHLLVPLTTRLQPDTAQALRRAYLEQKLRGQSPATQQEIVEEALRDWFRRQGYL